MKKYSQYTCNLHTGDTQKNMQQANYHAKEGPPVDDDYTWAGGEDRTNSNSRSHAQPPTGASRFPPPPTWTSVPTQRHVAPPEVKLPPFWAKDPHSWFTLVESTFNRHDVVDSRLRFDLVLPALPEEVIEQIRGVLCAVDYMDHPYVVLEARLLRLFTPKPADSCLKLIHSGELSDRRPTQLMEAMLALLPSGEKEGILFKMLYATKLPKEVRGHVLANGMHLDSRELSELADDLWRDLNERHSGAKSHPVVAAVQDSGDELAEAVAALNVQLKCPQHKKSAAKGGKSQGKLCHAHKKYGDDTWKCMDPRTCMWSGTE